MLLLTVLAAGAQEAGDVNSDTNEADRRPAETELLFDVPAEEGPQGEAIAPAELPGVGFGDFLRMIIVLALVIALIWVFVWMLKRFSAQKGESEEIINLLSTRPLKGDTALHLVEVGARLFLVGSCSNAVNLISEIDDDESMDQIRLSAERTPLPVVGGFARMFRDRFGSGPSDVNPATSPAQSDADSRSELQEDPSSFLRSQRERLKDL